MIQELDRANAIITEYLSLARSKVVELTFQNLNSVVETVFPLIQTYALLTDKCVHLEAEEVPPLGLNEKEIRQLLLNLVRNGLEAMPPGGNLTIRTFKDGEDVVLSVRDEGTGIEPAVLEKLGTPFVTTKDHGTGLGLAVCYSIAARHNAVIEVRTGPAGTTFFIRFRKG
jgi:signal transduction histidine kinase